MLIIRRCNYQERLDPVDQCHQNAMSPSLMYCFGLVRCRTRSRHLPMSPGHSHAPAAVFGQLQTSLFNIKPENKTVKAMGSILTLLTVFTFSYYVKSCHLAISKLTDKKICSFTGLSLWDLLLDWRVGLFPPKSETQNAKGCIVHRKTSVNIFSWVPPAVDLKTTMWIQVSIWLSISATGMKKYNYKMWSFKKCYV